jgi:hypothetical protein
MQLPTTIEGMKAVLRDLGYPKVLDGVDLNSPNLKDDTIARIKWEFEQEGGEKELTSVSDLEKAISLVERFPWAPPVPPGHLAPNTMESSVETLPAPKNAPPPTIMKIVDFDKPAQEIVIEKVKKKLDDSTAKGTLPPVGYGVAHVDGGIEVLVGETASKVKSFLNLPVVLAEALQGRGALPKGMDRYHAYYESIRHKIREAVKTTAAVEPTVVMSSAAHQAVEYELLGAFMSVVGHDKPLFSREDFTKDPVKAVNAYKVILKRAGYTEQEMAPPEVRS